uniref:Uncharacterized protein n=1 Tax=Arundo donax TaxID=35708 RepID=A0A0A9FDH5_ARUDO
MVSVCAHASSTLCAARTSVSTISPSYWAWSCGVLNMEKTPAHPRTASAMAW